MAIGILALQGAVEPHRQKFAALGVESRLVRTAEELASCAGLVMPGGESTTLLNLIGHYRLREPLLEFARRHPIWGVCAGTILMAERAEHPPQECLGLLPITVHRNAYGRQNESFIAPVGLSLPGENAREWEGVFIRAPRIAKWGPGIETLACHEGDPVAIQAERHMATTFHPELSPGEAFHRHFLALCRERSRNTA